MTVFHGTGFYALEGIKNNGLELRNRHYVKRKCACTTTDLQVAQLFAVRRSTTDEFLNGKISGIVLEFELEGVLGRHYEPAKDYHTGKEEHEIAVYDPKFLRLTAIHRWDQDWIRKEVVA